MKMAHENKIPWEKRAPLTVADCIQGSAQMDWEGEILVINTGKFNKKDRIIQNSLWKALGGFGCTYSARGRAVLAECLGDGETVYFDRSDFFGIVKTGVLQQWLKDYPVPDETPDTTSREAEQDEGMEVY